MLNATYVAPAPAAYVRLIPPGAADTVHFRVAIPKDVVGPVTLEAKLNYRKFGYYYTKFAIGGVAKPGSAGGGRQIISARSRNQQSTGPHPVSAAALYGSYGALLKTLDVDPEDVQAHYNLVLCYRGFGQNEKAEREEKLFLRFKTDQASQSLTAEPRLSNPEDNNERQPIHDHVSGLIDGHFADPPELGGH